ncbi:hypothetical protein FOPE_07744 [Fonsecaea pedrosoi]|nr:hypothetical protein FOPE_07744 [Fonsecaea pedrosoi]
MSDDSKSSSRTLFAPFEETNGTCTPSDGQQEQPSGHNAAERLSTDEEDDMAMIQGFHEQRTYHDDGELSAQLENRPELPETGMTGNPRAHDEQLNTGINNGDCA